MKDGRTRTVILDDELPIVNMLTRVCEGEGHLVRPFMRASEALHCLATEPIDLLITDMCMPESDGITVTEEAWRLRPDLYVLIITGHAGMFPVENLLAGGHAAEADLQRFRTEAEAIARLTHPNIVQVHEVGEYEGRPYFSLEFCPGGSLDRKLNGTPMMPREAAGLVETLARAIQAAHERGIVHRDLSPSNVLFDAEGTPKIADFGLAKKLDEATRTQSGAIMAAVSPIIMTPLEKSSFVWNVMRAIATGRSIAGSSRSRRRASAGFVRNSPSRIASNDPPEPRSAPARAIRHALTRLPSTCCSPQ